MKTYVTTSIPYVNAPPHIGFAMELITADVLARHARQLKNETLFATGTDEHGGKISEKADEAGKSVKEFTDEVSQQFKDLAKLLNVTNDKFIRTTDENHEKVAQKVWELLKDDIFKNKYVGWYCTGDEAFFTETTVRENNGICPNHNRPYEKIEEENYFFRLSKYNSQILEAIKSDQIRIIPLTRKNEILSVIEYGLEDISISRPKEKISWGISVPGDDSQVMYVWFEALLNYISVIGFPDSDEFKKFWPADYHILGKDILRFHAAIWPGILIGLNQPLPKNLYVHGFVHVNNQKISKSLGNAINPKELVDTYGVDAFRYFFLRHIPSYEDGDFTWQKFHDAYQNELGNELGNAVQRTAVMVNNYLEGNFEISNLSNDVSDNITNLINDCKFDRSIEEIWMLVRKLNQYIEDEKPWVLQKEQSDRLNEVLNNQVNQLLLIAELLVPFLPDTSSKIKKIFNNGRVTLLENTLFPRIENDHLDK